MGLCAHADLDAGKDLCAETGDDRLDAIVAAGGTLVPDADAADRERNIVEKDDNVLGRNVIIVGGLAHSQAGGVHIGLRFKQKQLLPVIIGQGVAGLKFFAVHRHAECFRELVQRLKTGVVARFFILGARIAQAHQHPVTGTFVKEQHIRTKRTSNFLRRSAGWRRRKRGRRPGSGSWTEGFRARGWC